MNICEGILNSVESDIENYVELRDRMEKDLAWVKHIKQQDAVYYEAALFNITQDAFRKATSKSDAEFKWLLANFMAATLSPWTCYNSDECDDWEERIYDKVEFRFDELDSNILNAGPDDYRWNWSGSNSFYHFFWDGDYIHSLDQEDLLCDRKTQKYSKKLQDTASKYGLKLKPIF